MDIVLSVIATILQILGIIFLLILVALAWAVLDCKRLDREDNALLRALNRDSYMRQAALEKLSEVDAEWVKRLLLRRQLEDAVEKAEAKKEVDNGNSRT